MIRASRFCIFLAVCAFVHFYASANDKVWVGLSKADPRDWDDSENWLPPGAPSGGDRVYIGVSPHSGTYTVNINQSIDLAELALVRSTLNGAVLVNVNGGFSSEGGSLSGGLRAALKSGGAAKRGSGGEFALGLYGAHVENQGTFAISTKGTLGFSEQASTFINKGIVELFGGAAISFFSAGNSLFDNQGTLRTAADGTVASVENAFLNNAGTIIAQSGTLRFTLSRVTNNSTIKAEGSATNLFTGGVLVSNDGSKLDGSGWHHVVGADWLVNGNSSALQAEFSGDNRALTLAVGSELDCSGQFRWTGGTIASEANAGKLRIMPRCLGSIQGANKKTLDNAIFANESTTTWRDAGDLALVNGARLENASGKTFVIYNDRTILGGGKESVLHNSGKLLKTSALSGLDATTLVGAGVRFEHGPDLLTSPLNCSLQVFRGSLRLEGGGAIGGSTTIQAGSTIEFCQGNYSIGDYGVIRGDGWALVTGGTLICFVSISPFTTETLPVAIDNLELTSGAVQGAPNDFGIASELTVKKSFRWTGGRIGVQDARTRTVFRSETETLLTGSDQKRIDQGNVELLGRGSWDGTGPLILANNGRIDLGSSVADAAFECLGNFAVLSDRGRGTIFSNPKAVWHLKPASDGRIDVDIENSGEVIFENGVYILAEFTIRKGQVNLNGPQLKIPGGMELTGGALSGSGTIDGSVQNNGGEIKPGDSPGHLVIVGGFRQAGLGRTTLQIGGYEPSQRDLLEILGNASLDGTLRLELLNSFVPKAGDRFGVMRFGSRSNTFQIREGMLISPGLIVVPEYSATNMVLVAQAFQTQSPIMAIVYTGGLVNLSWPSVPAVAYQLETSIDLDRWTVLSNFPAEVLSPAFSVKPSEPQRFYRLR
jgi:phage baseplate assembly protein gpV